MGDFELGVLLGNYGGAQSFEGIGSWEHLPSASSFFIGQTEVHSSPGGARLDVFSRNGAADAFRYNYAAENDAYARWSPDVTTHKLVAHTWIRIDDAAHSGDVIFALGTGVGQFVRIPFSTSLELQSAEIFVTSADNILMRHQRLGSPDSFSLHVDDVLLTVDAINLHPNWDYTENEEIIKHLHTTIGGQTLQFKYSNFFKFEIGLFAIPTSQANLINFWWDNKFNLVYRPDTSDSNLVYIVRLANISKPLDTIVEVNENLWSGRLQLESITSKLVY